MGARRIFIGHEVTDLLNAGGAGQVGGSKVAFYL